jgi:protein SCO1/2
MSSVDTPTAPGRPEGAAAAPDPAGPSPAARRRRLVRALVLVVGIPVLLAAGGYVGFRMFRPHVYAGTVMQAPTRAAGMDGLVFADGTPVDLERFRGDVVLVYFGYMNCPDVCPTTLAKAAAARARLGDADRVHVIMVSVDPERDAPGALGRFVASFDPDFLGATGELEDVSRVASTYGVFFARGEGSGDDYAVDHTATLMGIDTDGRLRIVWPTDVTAADLAADVQELL